jgi:hypothetical protein
MINELRNPNSALYKISVTMIIQGYLTTEVVYLEAKDFLNGQT